jgi:GT2 family glycosyltransferase
MNTDIREPKEAGAAAHAAGHKLLMIGQPITGNWIHKKTYASCMNVISPMPMIELLVKHQVATVVRVINDFPIDYNRNKFVDEAIAAGADYLMFMDMDQTFPTDTIAMLFDHISDENPVVAGMYFLKKEPFSPVVGRYTPWTESLFKNRQHLEKQGFVLDDSTPNGQQLLMWQSVTYFDRNKGPFYADVIGMGCVLVKTDIFKKLSRPYFRYSYDPEKGDDTLMKLSEDMYWCAQLKKAGIPILIDPRVQCGHLMDMESNVDLYENHREAVFAHLKANKRHEYNKTKKAVLDVRSEQQVLPKEQAAAAYPHAKEKPCLSK